MQAIFVIVISVFFTLGLLDFQKERKMGVNVPLAPPIPYRSMGGNAKVELFADNLNALDATSAPVYEQPKEKIQQCKICGGILHNNHCDYCGAEY